MSRVLNLSDEILQHVTTGKTYRPNMSTRFPAKILESPLDWEDLVLNPLILDEVENIKVLVKKADGKKCPRCWKIFIDKCKRCQSVEKSS